MSEYERFLAKVKASRPSECWVWIGGVDSWGYGSFWLRGENTGAHRYLYESLHGPIPTDLQLDHLCRVRRCVNPSHLEAVTVRENVLRGEGITAQNARKTHCVNGHEFTEANTRRYCKRDGRAARACRACARATFYRQKGGNSGSLVCVCGREFSSAKARAAHERACPTFKAQS